jgi:hypothetical protein
MDSDEALRLLRTGKEGVAEWNRRREAGEGIPDLVDADLIEANLAMANLAMASLLKANLAMANLAMTSLLKANLAMANLFEATLARANLRGADLRGANLSLARLIRCKLDDAIFDEADVTECHILETFGRPKPPRLLRFQDRSPLMGEDAWYFFNPPAIVEVYLTEILTDEELGAFHFHLGDMRRQGVGIGVHLRGYPGTRVFCKLLRLQEVGTEPIHQDIHRCASPTPAT